jgi:hypothetical protein
VQKILLLNIKQTILKATYLFNFSFFPAVHYIFLLPNMAAKDAVSIRARVLLFTIYYHKKKYLLLLMKSILSKKTLSNIKLPWKRITPEHNIGPLRTFPRGLRGDLPSPYTTLLQDRKNLCISQRIPKNHSHGS